MVDNIVDNSIDEDTGACILLVSSWATIFFFGNQISPTSANNRSRIRVWILAILFWFLLRSGREYESPVSDSEKSSPQFLSYFSIPPSFCRQSVEPNSNPPFKEQNAHVASVKYILGSHASYLMSGKELSKLVAFVKGTQFDLVEFLQRERYESARLDNFASGLELIGQKLQMGILQSRLDAEFLLAHMCSVKFKEWIVVLATLLRRSEILFDLFQHDMRLWKAYSTTIQSHSAFTRYHDLLRALEEKLSLTRESEET